MKLATFSTADNSSPRLGKVTEEGIVDLSAIDGLPRTMSAYLSGGRAAASAVASINVHDALPLAEVSLLAPVPNPGKVLGIGLNYADHVAESGMEQPNVQVWFNKQHNCINAPYAASTCRWYRTSWIMKPSFVLSLVSVANTSRGNGPMR